MGGMTLLPSRIDYRYTSSTPFELSFDLLTELRSILLCSCSDTMCGHAHRLAGVVVTLFSESTDVTTPLRNESPPPCGNGLSEGSAWRTCTRGLAFAARCDCLDRMFRAAITSAIMKNAFKNLLTMGYTPFMMWRRPVGDRCPHGQSAYTRLHGSELLPTSWHLGRQSSFPLDGAS